MTRPSRALEACGIEAHRAQGHRQGKWRGKGPCRPFESRQGQRPCQKTVINLIYGCGGNGTFINRVPEGLKSSGSRKSEKIESTEKRKREGQWLRMWSKSLETEAQLLWDVIIGAFQHLINVISERLISLLDRLGSEETVGSETWAQPSWTDILAAGSLTAVSQWRCGFGECNQRNQLGAVDTQEHWGSRRRVISWGGT